ncbi:hypothetical protein FKM82_026728 [Ascaphus truei]
MQEEIDKTRKVIEQSLEDFAASLPLDFAASLKKNGKLRDDYRNMVKKASEEFLNLADQEASGLATLEEKLTVYKDYAKKAVEARNSLMEISRDKITQGGKLLSLIKKEKGLTLPELLERYSNKQFQKAYAELAFEEQFSVMGSIIEASGRTNALFNKVAKFGGQAMLGLFVVTLGISLYASLTSENPLKETARTIVGLGFGVAGTVVATELLAGVAVCGGPIGALIAVVIEGAVGLVLALAGLDGEDWSPKASEVGLG